VDIAALSDEQLAGQRLMVGFEGTELNKDLMFLIDTLKVGGIILFAENLSKVDQIKQLCFSVQDYTRSCGQPPLFIAIDQEGGQVARLKEPFTRFPGNPKMKGTKDAIRFARVTAAELKEVGINMNLAPVLDVVPEGIESVMSNRSFGNEPVRVSELGVTVIEHLQESKIMSVAKHFPGIGRTILDSHVDMPSLNIDAKAMESTDLVPFEAAIKHEVSGVMVSHILYNKIDPEWPASLSTKITGDILRKRMGFEGIIITDDLDMGAIKKHYDIKTVIRQILLADVDIALICHKGPDIENAFVEILSSLGSSQSQKVRGVESVKRIIKLKKKYLEPISKTI
jgi:beta-N-acetylhexosaminidase